MSVTREILRELLGEGRLDKEMLAKRLQLLDGDILPKIRYLEVEEKLQCISPLLQELEEQGQVRGEENPYGIKKYRLTYKGYAQATLNQVIQ